MKYFMVSLLGTIALYIGICLIAFYASSQVGAWGIYLGGFLIGTAYAIARGK